MAKNDISTLHLFMALAGFFIVGSGMTFVIWHTLSDFLAGRPVEGGRYLLALALSGLFVALVWLLAHYVQRVIFRSEPNE